jgi:MFS-type transporter involved in bile tolerance (Atg22 family)
MKTNRLTAFLIAASLIFLMSVTTVVAYGESVAQPSPVDNALQLLAIELFFLLVGLFVVAVLGYLIWESWRRKKEKGKKTK